jgi:type IV secretion system protein TrbJ
MMLRTARLSLLIGAAMIALAVASAPTLGQMVVYDPSNYAQNVVQAARALQQINNQVTSLQNQTQRLLNQVRNLTSLPYSSLLAIEQSITRTQQLLNQAQRIAYDINQIDQAFGRTYPQSYSGSTSSQQLIGDAQTRWQNSLAAHQDAMRVQAGVVQALDTSRLQTNGLVSSSQSAVGILQASQAGNQLIALQTRQLVDLTALIAAQARAQSLDGARNTANQEQGRVQLNQFLTTSRGYQPQTVQMFHQ